MTQTQRLFYEDSTNNLNIIADIGDGETSNVELRKAQLRFRKGKVDKYVAWVGQEPGQGANALFGELPVKKTNFAADEPEIYWQEQRNDLNIESVSTTNDTVTVSGDHTEDFREGGAVRIRNSTGNDGNYTVADINSVSYSAGSDETTITVEQSITDSTADGNAELWENIFRGYLENQGVITQEGLHKFVLYDHSKYTGKQKASVSTAVNTHIVDAFTQNAPSSYTIDAPSSSSVTYIDDTGTEQTGYPPIDDYTNTGKRTTGYSDLTSKTYGWAVKFRADKTIRYEPTGFGGTVDTVEGAADYDPDTDTSRGTFLEWSKERLSGLDYTQAQVIGTDSNQQEIISDVKENTSLVNDYGEIFKSFKIDFDLGDKAEADRIANNLVSDVQNPTEAGRVTVKPRYHTNVSNDSFQLLDSQRGIDAVYTCYEQINFYPENKTELRFQFEEESERKAENYENLRGERDRLYPSSQTDVGSQTVDSTTEDVTDSYDEHDAAAGDHDLEGQTFTESQDDTATNGAHEYDSSVGGSGSAIFVDIDLDFIDGDTDYAIIAVTARVTNDSSTVDGWNLDIQNLDTSTNYAGETDWMPGDVIGIGNTVTRTGLFFGDEDMEGDTVRVSLTNFTGSSEEAELSASVMQVSELTVNQPADPDGAQPRSDGSTNDTNPSDSSAGDTTSLDADGTSDPKNVNVGTEDKAYR